MSFCCSRARGHAACLRSQPVLSDHYHLLPVTVCSAGMETYVCACVWPSREHSLHVVCGGGVSCLSRATRSLCFVVGVSWTELSSAGESCSTKWTCSTSPPRANLTMHICISTSVFYAAWNPVTRRGLMKDSTYAVLQVVLKWLTGIAENRECCALVSLVLWTIFVG